MTLFVKHHNDPGQTAAARDNYAWLASLDAGVLLPQLVAAHDTSLAFTKLDGARPGPGDLTTLAVVIGRMHRAAAPALAGACLNQRHVASWPVIADFTESRRAALHLAAWQHLIPARKIDQILDAATAMPPAFYKDCNLRNFILTSRGAAVVDFDDLTLAPYGYDLAKLIVSFGMTFGQVMATDVSAALGAYNSAIGCNACTPSDLAVWAELNWLLTESYLGRHGYEHPWPLARPWPNPFLDGVRWQSPPN